MPTTRNKLDIDVARVEERRRSRGRGTRSRTGRRRRGKRRFRTEEVAIAIRGKLYDRYVRRAVRIQSDVGRARTGQLDFVAVDASRIDSRAGRAEEDHIDKAIGIDLGQSHGSAIAWASQSRVRSWSRSSSTLVENEALRSGRIVHSQRIGPLVGDEGHCDIHLASR